MLIQIFFLFLSLSLSLSPWTTERKAKEKKFFSSLIHFFLLHPNRGHFVIVQTFIHRVCVVFQIESEAKQKESKTSEYLLWKQNIIQI